VQDQRGEIDTAMGCREAIQEVFADASGALAKDQVIERIYAKYPERPWKESTIYLHLEALSVNRPAEHRNAANVRNRFLVRQDDRKHRVCNSDVNVRIPGDVEEVNETASAGIVSLDSAVSAAISLERDLEAFVCMHLDQIEPGLRLHNTPGSTGRQVAAGDAGRIDILAVDRDGAFVVIEIKAGTADDGAFGQLLGYMGWASRELADGKPVRGIVVANDFRERAKYAAEALPNVSLKKYAVSFAFSDVSV